ncbi:MAG: O-antigen ligase family protein, partial [Actinomycetia bacterium]|nr:O-antigen ligase family protein [Actinomycetes bacterium]
MQKMPYGLNDISVLLIGRSSGVFTSPIVLGLFLCMVFPLAIYDVFYSETAGKKLLGATYSFFIFISVFYTESKTALSIILLITAYLIIEYVINKKKNRILIIIVFFTLLILMGIVFKGTVQKMIDNAGMSIKGRFMIWEISLRSVSKKPLLGEGLNMYPVSYLKHQDKEIMSRFQKNRPEIVYHPHNLFLDISTESGLTSFLFYLFLLGSIMFPLMKKKGNKSKSEITPFMLSVFGYLLAMMVSWSISMVNAIFWLILGILYKKLKDIEVFNIYTIKPNKYLKNISYAIAITLMMFSSIRGISYVNSEIKHYKIEQYVVSNPIQAMSIELKDLQFKSFESYHWYYISFAFAMTWNNSLERLSRDEKINGFQLTEYTAYQAVILNPYNIEALLL